MVADPRLTLGHFLYLWFDVPEDVDSVSTWHNYIYGLAGVGICGTLALADVWIGGICGVAYVVWGDGGSTAITEAIRELPASPPDDCQLVLAFPYPRYPGLLRYVEHSGCGTDFRRYTVERTVPASIFRRLFG